MPQKQETSGHTLRGLLEQIDEYQQRLTTARARMIVSIEHKALEPGDERPELHHFAGELGNQHLKNQPLSEALSRFPDLGEESLEEIFGQNSGIVTGLLAMGTSGQQPESKNRPVKRQKKEKPVQRTEKETGVVIEDQEFYRNHPQILEFFRRSELWQHTNDKSFIPLKQLREVIASSFMVHKRGEELKSNLVEAVITYQLGRFRKDSPEAIEVQREGNKKWEIITKENALDLFKQLGCLDDRKQARYRLVDAGDLPRTEVKKK